MTNFKFIKAEAINEFTVKAHNEIEGFPVTVSWETVHAGTGESITPYLDSFKCDDIIMHEIVEEALRDGEDGLYGDLYLHLRDSFNSNDVLALLEEFKQNQ